MTRIATIRDRLQHDDGLPALLDTAYAAFEVLLSAVEEHQDPASVMFVQFVYAATCAANGRDAILFAPSLPTRPLHPADAAVNSQVSASDVPDLAALSKKLYLVLAQAASVVASQDDRAACHHAAGHAADIYRLLTGAEP